MSYKADDRCRKCGPVGNGACRGTGRYGEPGYFDDYENFHPDQPPVDDSYEREQREKQKELKAELRQQRLEEEAEQRRREVQSRSAPQPQPDPGLGALPVVAGIFAGIAAAKASGERKRRMSPPPVRPRPQTNDTATSAQEWLLALVALAWLIAAGYLGVTALFGAGSWLRLFLFLGGSVVLFFFSCFLSVLFDRRGGR